MAYLYPRFYNCSVSAAFAEDLPQLAQLCEGSKPTLASDKRMEQLFSIKGDKFVSFVKSEHYVEGEVFLMHCWSFLFYFLGILLLHWWCLKHYRSVMQTKTSFGRCCKYTTTTVTGTFTTENQNCSCKLCRTLQKHLSLVLSATVTHYQVYTHYHLRTVTCMNTPHPRPSKYSLLPMFLTPYNEATSTCNPYHTTMDSRVQFIFLLRLIHLWDF